MENIQGGVIVTSTSAARLPPPLPLPPSVPPGPPAPPPPPPPPPSPSAAASWLVETAEQGDSRATVGLCESPCIFRSATAYKPAAFANVLDANTYGNENASGVCAGPRNVNYDNQVWRRAGNMLQTHAFGLPFCLTGVLLMEDVAAGGTNRRPTLRNMSVVVEPCNNGSAAQSWSLDVHTQDSLLSIRWNGGRGGTVLCVTVVSATSPDIPGGAQDIRLAPCPAGGDAVTTHK